MKNLLGRFVKVKNKCSLVVVVLVVEQIREVVEWWSVEVVDRKRRDK